MTDTGKTDAPAKAATDAPKAAAPRPLIAIPADWHEKMSVAEIVSLAAKINPAGNPVEVIRAEEARRAATRPA